MRKVSAVQDSDCHWYVIPEELTEMFLSLDEMMCSENQKEFEEADNKFNTIFGQYRTGGDLNNIQLPEDIRWYLGLPEGTELTKVQVKLPDGKNGFYYLEEEILQREFNIRTGSREEFLKWRQGLIDMK
jgi:hypothetical protein